MEGQSNEKWRGLQVGYSSNVITNLASGGGEHGSQQQYHWPQEKLVTPAVEGWGVDKLQSSQFV